MIVPGLIPRSLGPPTALPILKSRPFCASLGPKGSISQLNILKPFKGTDSMRAAQLSQR